MPFDPLEFQQSPIFKAFYAQHTEIAKAFCNGPWHQRFEDVICMHDFESGLKTEVTASGQWNIIVETLIPSKFALPLAVLYFDEYGRRCADSIYAHSMIDRVGNLNAPWYASAKIPFLPVREPFRMRVKCLPLRSWRNVKKFIVTSIVGTSWPSHLPIVGYERRNSNASSANPIKVDGPAPYTVKPNEEANETNPATEVDASADGSQENDVRHMPADDWEWLNDPPKVKLVKQSSKMYEGDRPVKVSNGGDQTSTGEHTHQKGGLVRGEATLLVRTPERRFEDIIKVMGQLRAEGVISGVRPVPAAKAWQQRSRGGRDCWSFIDEETARTGARPRKGWRVLEHASEPPKISIHRCALVLELTRRDRAHYWIEIECRKKEGGFRSAYLSKVGEDYDEALETAIETIAQAKGINLDSKLKKVFANTRIHVDSYKHHFMSKDRSDLDIESVRRFLVSH